MVAEQHGDGAGAGVNHGGRITLIKSPETMPAEKRVWPVSESGSRPLSDRENSVSGLGAKGTKPHTFTEQNTMYDKYPPRLSCFTIWHSRLL